MDIQNHQNMREKVEEKQECNHLPPPPATHSPPSPSSSPTHDFSFTISLHPPPTKITHDNNKPSKPTTTSPPPFAIDLSPADDIFFHGHLLPLHLLSHLPVSPRSSTHSLDSFTLPDELLEDQNNPITTSTLNTDSDMKGSNRIKSKSFSLFGLPKWRKQSEDGEKNNTSTYKKKIRLEVSQVLKRYVRMVRPLLSFRGMRRSNTEFHRQPYSFSGSMSSRSKAELRGRRGEFSAPASMRTSPTNSGLLLATSGTVTPTKATTDSTMEELQAAIQAAIAHCKNSIAIEEKIQCQD